MTLRYFTDKELKKCYQSADKAPSECPSLSPGGITFYGLEDALDSRRADSGGLDSEPSSSVVA